MDSLVYGNIASSGEFIAYYSNVIFFFGKNCLVLKTFALSSKQMGNNTYHWLSNSNSTFNEHDFYVLDPFITAELWRLERPQGRSLKPMDIGEKQESLLSKRLVRFQLVLEISSRKINSEVSYHTAVCSLCCRKRRRVLFASVKSSWFDSILWDILHILLLGFRLSLNNNTWLTWLFEADSSHFGNAPSLQISWT